MPYRARMDPRTLGLAGFLRSHPTVGESQLWERLRAKRLGGWRFRRQVPILGWVVDFYCPSAQVAVEVDGATHGNQSQQDARRDRALLRHGIQTLRFDEDLAIASPDQVAQAIGSFLEHRG